MDREQRPSPWMQDEGDLHASFDTLSGYQKALTCLGLTIAAWALLGAAAYGVLKLFHYA